MREDGALHLVVRCGSLEERFDGGKCDGGRTRNEWLNKKKMEDSSGSRMADVTGDPGQGGHDGMCVTFDGKVLRERKKEV